MCSATTKAALGKELFHKRDLARRCFKTPGAASATISSSFRPTLVATSTIQIQMTDSETTGQVLSIALRSLHDSVHFGEIILHFQKQSLSAAEVFTFLTNVESSYMSLFTSRFWIPE